MVTLELSWAFEFKQSYQYYQRRYALKYETSLKATRTMPIKTVGKIKPLTRINATNMNTAIHPSADGWRQVWSAGVATKVPCANFGLLSQPKTFANLSLYKNTGVWAFGKWEGVQGVFVNLKAFLQPSSQHRPSSSPLLPYIQELGINAWFYFSVYWTRCRLLVVVRAVVLGERNLVLYYRGRTAT